MEKYTRPELDISVFESTDVITTSINLDTDELPVT